MSRFFEGTGTSIMPTDRSRETARQGQDRRVERSRSTVMPTSHQNAAVPDFEVDQPVRIGLDALSPEERQIVEDATKSKARFLALIADPKNVERLRPTAPYYMLKITPSLRLIYTQEDDRIVVLDLTSQAMLDRFAFDLKRSSPVSPQEHEARALEEDARDLMSARNDAVRELFV